MIKSIQLVVLAIFLFISGSAFATSLGVLLDNSFNARNNLVDTAGKPYTYAEALSVNLAKIGETDLSLYSDLGLSNTYLDTSHKQFAVRDLYFDAPLFSDFDAKIGRQLFCDFASKNVCLDGAKFEYGILQLAKLHGYVGEPIPSLYGKSFVRHDLHLLQEGFGTDVALDKASWMGLQAAYIPDTSGAKERVPVSGYVDSRILKKLDLKLNASYDMASESMEEFGINISSRLTSHLQWRVYVLGENQAIDSTDAYEKLVLGSYTNAGVQLGYNDHKNYVRGYYSLRAQEHGSDHLAGIAASFFNVFLDLESGNGLSGNSIKTSVGYAQNIINLLQGGVAASYYQFKLSQNPSQEHSLTTRAFVNWLIPTLGISVSPEIQYLSNQYYHKDIRFQINAQYQYLSFWKSK